MSEPTVQTTTIAETIDDLLAQLRTAGEHPDPQLLDSIKALGHDAVQPLIAMATTPAEYEVAKDDHAALTGWAPYIAIDLLGELHPPEALEPLLSLLTWEDNVNLTIEVPDAIGRFGAAAIEPVTTFLADSTHSPWARSAAAESLAKITLTHPELQETIVATLTAQLDSNEPNTDDVCILNGFLVAQLVEQKARESAPSIIRAFEEDRVDIAIVAWPYVRDALDIPPDTAPNLDAQYPELRFSHPDDAPITSWLDTAPVSSWLDAPLNLDPETPYHRPTPKVGRNDPCPCGSAKKYKRCHGRS
jgi:hypothetical protein